MQDIKGLDMDRFIYTDCNSLHYLEIGDGRWEK